jgi:hypothetical protein
MAAFAATRSMPPMTFLDQLRTSQQDVPVRSIMLAGTVSLLGLALPR